MDEISKNVEEEIKIDNKDEANNELNKVIVVSDFFYYYHYDNLYVLYHTFYQKKIFFAICRNSILI